MKKYAKNIDDRKVLVARLSELTGLDSRYTFVPRCAYVIGAFTVEKDGCLTVENGADEGILETLKAEGLIGSEMEAPASVFPFTPVHQETAAPAPIPADLGTEDWGTDEWGEEEGTADAAAEEAQEVWQPDADIFAEPAPQEAPESTETENTEEAEIAEEADPISDAEYDQEAEEESAASLGIRDADEEAGHFPLDASISFPIHNHTAASLSNLICMIHSRGALLSKATGGEFYADRELVDEILDKHTFLNPKDLVAFVKEWNETGKPIKGIDFEENKLTFDGFTGVKDAEHLHTYTKLAAAMNKMALTQKRVQAKDTDDSNEKYSLRIWLVRLGMNGADYKADRKILMENLSGHSAFRNDAEKERWTVRQQAKRDALRAAKAESGEA